MLSKVNLSKFAGPWFLTRASDYTGKIHLRANLPLFARQFAGGIAVRAEEKLTAFSLAS
jgi:hypothetical protein